IGPGVVSSVIEDHQGRIWAATAGGISVLQQRDRRIDVRRIDRSSGLPSDGIDALARDASGVIWASTDSGIATVDPLTLRARAFGPADGATVDDGAYAVSQAADGTIFFGTRTGVAIITAGADSPWNYAPPVVLDALKLGGRSVSVASVDRAGANAELPAGDHDISAEFAALDYSDPAALRYSYMLEGYDRGWIGADSAHRSATYTNLAPGQYTLRIRATNRRGVWSKDAVALSVVALPAWYETWWFRAFAGAVIVAGLLLIYAARTEALRRRAHLLEAIVDERTRELSVANVALSNANVALEEMSLTDPLTKLRNRRFLMQNIEDVIAPSVRRYDDWRLAGTGEPPHDADLLFFLLDIDHFKAVNDELGHAAGDAVLTQMRERLEQVFRTSDYVLRWGGEEFLAIARGTRRSDAPEMAERLLDAVGGYPFVLESGRLLAKTASIGFAAFPFVPTAPQAVSWSQVVELADHALYMAKRGGRNTWYGITASERVDVVELPRALASSAEKAMRGGSLQIVSQNTAVSEASSA
ncbi:MAG TPA: GGDEF domain-containing protein, partial [Candidatus Baltobacteraceae bacterium]|nr:GGDEF domain-containing protein [Candidatus Baltobacteraceae bacterium]